MIAEKSKRKIARRYAYDIRPAEQEQEQELTTTRVFLLSL